MPQLSPPQAAAIASAVYDLRENSVSGVSGTPSLTKRASNPIGIKGMFATSDSDQLRGVSGVLAWTEITGFGYIAQGLKGTAYEDEALVALRGTDITPDWLTDANIGVTAGPTGSAVHLGFNTTWKSFAPKIQTYFGNHKPKLIHCVGHSLGGALATLTADYLKSHTGAFVELYTFGCPRVGGYPFATALTEKLTSQRIHRVFHPADPVPMVPLFPFLHVPIGGDGLALAIDETTRISPDAHKMDVTYVPGVADKSWAQLKANGAQTLSDRQIRSWLKRAGEGGGVIAFGARTSELISIALDWILRQVGTGVLIGLQAVIGGGITLVDQLAYLLHRGVETSVEVAGYVKSIVAAIMKFAGRAIKKGVSLTLQFIRYVLDILMTTMRMMVRGALIALL